MEEQPSAKHSDPCLAYAASELKTHSQKTSESAWGSCRIVKNLLIVSFGFLLLFTGYNGVATVQSTLNEKGGIGVASQAVIYAAYSVSSLMLPKIVITRFGCKKVLVLSLLSYCPYIASNFYPTWWDIIPTSLLLGIGAGALWPAESTYLNRLARFYHGANKGKAQESTTATLFGVFGMFYMSTNIFGNLISFVILRDDSHHATDIHGENLTSVCGLQFSEVTVANGKTALREPDDKLRYLLTGICLLCGLLSSVLVAVLLDIIPDTSERKDSKSALTNNNMLLAAFKLLKNKNQLLLLCISFYIGLSQGFFIGDFTKAYVACSWGVYHVGLVALCSGAASSVSSVLSGRMVKYFGRPAMMVTVAVAGIALHVLLFVWKPDGSAPAMFFVEAVLFGYVYGALWSQIRAFYGILFQEDEEAAFGNLSLWNSLGYCLSFAYSDFLRTTTKLYVLIFWGITGLLGYAIIEIKEYRSLKK